MKKTIAIALTLVMSQFALAHELDQVSVSNGKKAQTIVIKTSKDGKTLEIARVDGTIPAGKKIASKLKYQQVALNGEVKNQEINASNELDVTSSTSSWGFAVGWGGGYGYRGYRTPYWNNAYYGGYYGGYGYYRPTYYNNYASYYTAPYYADYAYGSAYIAQPYYGYTYDNCNYTYYSGYGYGGGYGYPAYY